MNLSNYQIKGTNNGTAWGDNGERELALTGTLDANSVYIICPDAADQTILDKANLALPYESPVHYNGNDAIGIFGKEPPVMTTREELKIDKAREEYKKLLSQGWIKTKPVW